MILFQRYSFFLCFILISTFLSGCGGMKRHTMPAGTLEGSPGHFWMGQILDPGAARAVSFEELIEVLASKDVLFVGEVHDNPEHHLIQVQILQALKERVGPFDVAMEFFERSHQPALDRYLRGETGEGDFLEEIDWRKSWGFDYAFYRPLLQWARSNTRRVIALNAPREVVRKVARRGLEALEPSERAAVAREIDLENPAHRAFLKEIFEAHQHGDLEAFDFFYEAQCVWEDTMAETLADYFPESGGKVVVFCGNGHIVNRFGIPDRLVRRIPVSSVTLIPHPLQGREALDRNAADYLWLTAESPPRFRMPHPPITKGADDASPGTAGPGADH